MSRIGNEYPDEYYTEVNFNCDDCEILNEDIETLVSGGSVAVKCRICNHTNTWEMD